MKKIIKTNKKINPTFYMCGLFLLLLLAPLSTFAANAINDGFGVNMHLRNRIVESEWDTALDIAADNNVEWAREEFDWSVIEPTDGSYNFDAYDTIVEKYNAKGIKILGLITYSPSWASSNPGSDDYEYYAPDLDAWKDYVSTLTTRYAGKVDAWEIWNEPNYDGFWKSETTEYIEMFEAAAVKINSADPDALVVLGGLSGVDSGFLQEVYNLISDEDYFDVIAIHPYRVVSNDFNYSPEETVDGLNTLFIDLMNIRAVAKNNKDKGKPIWLTEFGWTTYDNGVSKATQANYLMRGYAIATTVPKVTKIFWYNFKDDANNTSYYESNFGLVANDYNAKTSLHAFNFLQTKLDQKKYIQSTLVNPYTLDDFSTNSGWEFSGTDNSNGVIKENENGLLKVYYNFYGEDINSYLPIAKNIQMKKGTEAISFKAKGNNDTTQLRVRIKDSNGEIFQYNLGYLPKNLVTYRINLKNFSANWGGDKDSALDQPLSFQSFILDDNPDGSQASGYVYFNDLEASKKGHVYIHKYVKNKKASYLIWTTGKSRIHNVRIEAKQLRVHTLSKTNIKKSSNNKFLLRVCPRPKLLEVKK